jgi:hypothetical protein
MLLIVTSEKMAEPKSLDRFGCRRYIFVSGMPTKNTIERRAYVKRLSGRR